MNAENGKVLDIIGSTELIKVDDIENVPAKIDSGADSSSVWASCIRISKNGILSFRLFNKNSPLYTGKTIKKRYVGLPWWLSGKESTYQCRGHKLDPWSGRIPHAAGQLSLCARATEPAF